MKCRCGSEIRSFRGKWWHLCEETDWIHSKRQITLKFYKVAFNPYLKPCVNAEPQKKLKARSEKGNCETEPSSRDKEAISPRKPELKR